MKRFLSVILAAALLAGVCVTPASAKDTSHFQTFPEDVPAAALEMTKPDDTAFCAAADALDAAQKAGTVSDAELAALYDTLSRAWNHLNTVGNVCELCYNRNPDSCRTEYLSWSAMHAKDASRYSEVLRAALSSQYRDGLREHIGDKAADAILAQTPDTPEQLALLTQCDSLVDEYWTGMNAAYTADVGGKMYTNEALSQALESGELDNAQYVGGYLQIMQQKNAAVTPLLASLVKLRNEYAVSKGYQNFTEYAYPNIYARDFSADDAKALEAYVKEYIVPVKKLCEEIRSHNSELSQDRISALKDLSQQQILDLVRPCMASFSGEYAKLFAYMEQNRLCDIGPADTKLASSYTTPLDDYASAYIFIGDSNADGAVTSLVHEFGHFAQFCLDDHASSAFDVSEIDSQGLEALFLNFADGLAGEDGGDALRAFKVYSLVSGIIDGCLYDEFQQALYENGNLTPAEMNRLFRRLALEYGDSFSVGGDEAYAWIDVDHTFTNPLYYISYATSACTALELLGLSMDDYDAATDKYLRLTADSGDASYRALIQKEGLTDVFSADGVQKIAGDAKRYMETEAADVPDYTDLAGHWFEDGAKLISAEGLMRGDGTSFSPDGRMTRAMFVAVLYRLLGAGETAENAVFHDVQDPSAWYYDAVNWAAESGYIEGCGGEFHPEEPLTRQDMAVILARAFVAEDTPADENVLARYADSANISDYARSAAALVTSAGLMVGSGESFCPRDDATRAEAGQAVLRCAD